MKEFVRVNYKYQPNDNVADLKEVNDLLDTYSQTYEPSRSHLLNEVKENFPIVTDQNNKIKF